ncbi:MAG: TonB-dependent receptor [Bacteroidia bacterium]|nr:TonB-dependent receptor [Bacteroidia bacterium]
MIKIKTIIISYLIGSNCIAQQIDSVQGMKLTDTIRLHHLNEIVISASRISETILRSPISIDQLKAAEINNLPTASAFEAIENMKGVHILTPSLGFKVINTRGFANTTNVRFTQLIDEIDNQAPHIGAPIANALGADDLDIDKIEIIPGTASALYGMNAINGLVNIRTKDPFRFQGLSIRQLSGLNHLGNNDEKGPQFFSQTNLRYAQSVKSKFAFKINLAYTNGNDWVADNKTDLASTLNSTTGLTGQNNPAFDEVNSYGNESPNRRTLTLNGKKYVVARTGYRETEIADYNIQNYKGDIGLFFKPKHNTELSLTYKGAQINTIYQRSNRFRLQNYTLQQYTLNYHSPLFLVRTYLTKENTGRSYNLRSLAENMDRAFKTDNQWFSDYTTAYSNAISAGENSAEAHQLARNYADNGRYEPGTRIYEQKKEELININNWDIGAALRVHSYLSHSEGLFKWDKLFPVFFNKIQSQLLSGFDHRSYIIIPDGNYFINPVDSTKNIVYSKTGGFIQLNKDVLKKQIRISATIRGDKSDYFDWKFNPRIAITYSPEETICFRTAYQSGYRFPSIFEGFSNVNSGGVKRVGGLPIMSNGVFENSYTKISIDEFQAEVNSDINTLGLTQAQAIEKNKSILKKNTYTYLQPEFVRSFEFGFRGLILHNNIYIDADLYYNSYNNFIAQVETNIPKTNNSDSIPTYLYSRLKQDRYRLWTNSKSKIYNYGANISLKYKYNELYSLVGNITYSKLDRTDNKDGLEDGYNTPEWMLNGTLIAENIWKTFGASISARYQSKFDYVSFLVNGSVPSYWTLNAQINYFIQKTDITIKLGGNNLLNKPYYSLLGGSSEKGFYYLSFTMNIKSKNSN